MASILIPILARLSINFCRRILTLSNQEKFAIKHKSQNTYVFSGGKTIFLIESSDQMTIRTAAND